jgi:hypothetical protein
MQFVQIKDRSGTPRFVNLAHLADVRMTEGTGSHPRTLHLFFSNRKIAEDVTDPESITLLLHRLHTVAEAHAHAEARQ